MIEAIRSFVTCIHCFPSSKAHIHGISGFIQNHLVSGISGSSGGTGASLHLTTMTDFLWLSSNRPDLAASLPSIGGKYSRCFLCLALSRRDLNYRRWALSRRGFRVTTSTTIDMVNELTYSGTEQQLRQLALIRAHNLLQFEVVIWGYIDILVVALRILST